METFFYIVPTVMIVGVLFFAYKALGRTRQVRAAWDSGFTAEGRCLRAYTRTSGGGNDTSVSTTLHHVYEFTTRDGRAFRFDEGGGPGTVIEGDIVTVYYAPDHPERATAHRPNRARLALGTGFLLAFFAVFITFCIGFMVIAHTFLSEADGLLP
ncbi:DUF3592 domain-containing protein [Streptomyces sp. ID05-04B]|uniref:DUF3592 domain-containing protein n=1 Tax=unclassified Streptomyces TaxID=2593676 RepID=UPI000D19D4C2|nr:MULTISPECIES: DUF3592 domain-containing protein [unclassified Streptomyces]AVV42435.1 hypothetical protein C6376_14395 [Streptomyces sp. P3]MDX5570409.1 DUF3592 domain-containing protein [Streptomyces sp. ID05-04B]